MKKVLFIALFCIAIVFGFYAKNFNVRERAIHADESEQASTFLKLYTSGEYKYNPQGPHGPTLYYWTNAIEKIFESDASKIDISQLRQTQLPFFVFILCAFAIFSPHMGRMSSWGAAACLSVSGLACIYSVYYVQEIIFALLIFCTATSLWVFAQKPKWYMIAITGAFAGLACATKETVIISFAAMFGALALSIFLVPEIAKDFIEKTTLKKRALFLFIFITAFAIFFVPLITSFGANMSGFGDFFGSYYGHFFGKSANAAHESGGLFYFKLLTLQKCEGAWFGELPITILAIFGTLSALLKILRGKPSRESAFAIFCALNAIFAIAILSLIKYKTPWLLLSPMVFICATAGYAVMTLFKLNRAGIILALAILASLGYWQYKLDVNAVKRYHSDPRNPFIYSHTVTDIDNLTNRIKQCVKVSEHGKDLPIAFITRKSVWPMPWTLRDNPNIGYWNGTIPDNISIFDIIVTDNFTNSEVSAKIDQSKYESEFFGLRKNLLLNVYIKKQLYNKAVQEN